jgi:heme/copper-type cytochrome/quinol oxidase subunit 2
MIVIVVAVLVLAVLVFSLIAARATDGHQDPDDLDANRWSS